MVLDSDLGFAQELQKTKTKKKNKKNKKKVPKRCFSKAQNCQKSHEKQNQVKRPKNAQRFEEVPTCLPFFNVLNIKERCLVVLTKHHSDT